MKEINPDKLKKYEDQSRGKVKIGLPQTPDMAVAYLAHEEGIPIVSSDLRLVEVAQQLGMNAMMNSAFLVMLIAEAKLTEDKIYLQELYDLLIAEEIMHSVNSQGKYDPVIRIQKIMDSAMNVVRQQSAGVKIEKKKKKVVLDYNFPAFKQLVKTNLRIRTDLSDYIEMIEEGNFKAVKSALLEGRNQIQDLLVENKFHNIPEDNSDFQEAITTLGHILLLSSSVALGEQRLDDAISIINQLSIMFTQNKQLEERLDIEIHLQRITIFFLTEQFSRFSIYFTPSFMELCDLRGREDIKLLNRTMAIITAVLSNKIIENTASAKDFSEIQFIIQIGVQFIAMKKYHNAWLLLLQAVYMSINSKMTGLLMAVFEVLLPLSFIPDCEFKPSFREIIKIAKKGAGNLPFEEYEKRSTRNSDVDEELLRKRTVAVSKLPVQFTGFLDVITAEIADFKKIGRCSFIRVIDWNTLHFIGIVDPTLSLDEKLTVGSSIKIHQGKLRVTSPSQSIRQKRNVDILMICKPEDLKFIVRRSGQLSVVHSKVGEYDL